MIRFGRAQVDVPARAVVLDGEPQHLEPQAFDLLAYLIEHRDRVVPKEELLDSIWGDQFVSESALTTRIKEVRRALGDDGTRQAVVRNHRGRGYRFVADLDDAAATGASEAVTQETLLGRERDLTAVEHHLDACPLVTLVGPGGVGKTTLAHAIGRRLAARFEGRVHLVDLAPVRDEVDVAHVLRQATGLTDTDDDTLPGAVAEQGALVLVDNCEHVLGAAARVLGAVLDHHGSTRIVATSRERLGVPGEQVHHVSPLDREAARSLLLERARAGLPGYEWSPDEEDDVDSLLEMLDRLPLAIEMAAGRLPSLGAHDLAAHLTGRLDLLRATDRGTAPRHRTLAELISWSEDLLDPDARSLLVDLSVFAGAVSAADLAPVVGIDEASLTLGPLATLCDHSLVAEDRSQGATRYRMLATVRAAVDERRSPAVDERHAEHVLSAANAADAALRGPDEPRAGARIGQLADEIRAAHRWARHHRPELAAGLTAALLHYSNERHWSEPASWCRDDRGRPVHGDAAFAAALAADASIRGDYELATELATVALDSTDDRVVLSGHDTLASVAMYRGELDICAEHGAALATLSERSGDPTAWALGSVNLVLAPLYDGRVEEARQVHDRLRPPGQLGPTCLAWLRYTEGELLAEEGRTDESIRRFAEAIELGSSVGSNFVVSVSRTSSFAVQARSGDVQRSLAEFVDVLVEHRRAGSFSHAVTALRNLVVLLVRSERDELAMTLLGALSDPTVKRTYGRESTLLDDARARVEARHGPEQVATWLAHGTGHGDRWALDLAIDALQ